MDEDDNNNIKILWKICIWFDAFPNHLFTLLQLYARHGELPRHKRNMRIVGGVSASVLISPVLAAVAVGVGVPILLGKTLQHSSS